MPHIPLSVHKLARVNVENTHKPVKIPFKTSSLSSTSSTPTLSKNVEYIPYNLEISYL
jgi:hypothetical protein